MRFVVVYNIFSLTRTYTNVIIFCLTPKIIDTALYFFQSRSEYYIHKINQNAYQADFQK